MRVIQNRFDGGIVNDPRDVRSNVCRVCTNFDALTNPNKLTPYRSSESGDSTAYESGKQNFAVALRTGTTYSLYALGHQSGNAKVEIMYKDLGTGSAHDLDDADWQSTSNNFSSAGSTAYDLFVYYPAKGKLYGAKGGNAFWGYYPDGGTAFEEDVVSSETSGGTSSPTYTTVAQAVVHSEDNILYIPYDNKIAINDNGAWTLAAFSIPSRYYITSICEHLGSLAIAAAPKNGVGISRVFLWDRDTTNTRADANIDWGDGIIKVLESLNGRLIGVSLSGANTTRFADRVIFREYDGYGANVIPGGILEGGTTTQLPIAKQKINNRLYFMMSITLNGSTREGVWSMGPTSSGYSIFHERTPNNDTALVSGSVLNFIYVGDYLFQSYSTSGVVALSKTDDQATYSATSIFETKINPGSNLADKFILEQLLSVGGMYEPLPSAGQVVLKYRVDSSSSYTTIFTETTDARVYTEPFTDAGGTAFKDGKEYEFRLESTGGAIITALHYNRKVLESNV